LVARVSAAGFPYQDIPVELARRNKPQPRGSGHREPKASTPALKGGLSVVKGIEKDLIEYRTVSEVEQHTERHKPQPRAC